MPYQVEVSVGHAVPVQDARSQSVPPAATAAASKRGLRLLRRMADVETSSGKTEVKVQGAPVNHRRHALRWRVLRRRWAHAAARNRPHGACTRRGRYRSFQYVAA